MSGTYSVPAGLLVAVMAGCAAAPLRDPCPDETTAGMRQCLSSRLAAAERRMQRYLEAALQVARPPDALHAAQAAWLAYRDRACRAAAGQYEGGSLRPVVALDCRLRLARERTLELWRAYLADDGQLPRPGP